MGLAASSVVKNKIEVKESEYVSVCPGPNLAYFSKYMSLKEIANQIYGMSESIARIDRPHFFIKELDLYIKYFTDRIEESLDNFNKKQEKYFTRFLNNLEEGLDYYSSMFENIQSTFSQNKSLILSELDNKRKTLNDISLKIKSFSQTLDS